MRENKFFFVSFFVLSYFLEGFKDRNYFLIVSVFFLIYFYWINIKISLSPQIFLVPLAFFSIIKSDFLETSYFIFYKTLVSVLFYYYFKNMEEDEKKVFFDFFKIFYIFYLFFLIVSFYISYVFKLNWYFIGKNNNYIAFLLSGGILIKYLDFKNSKRIRDIITMILFVFSLFFINSRSSYVSLIFSLFFISRNRLRFLFYFLLCCIFSIFILPDSFLNYILKLNNPKAYARLDIWISGIKGFLENPVFGNGIDFRYIFEKFKFPYFDGFNYYNHSTLHSHNEFINILAEYGILYFIIYLTTIKNSLETKNCYLKVLIINFTIFSFFDIVLKVPFFSIFYFSMLGIASGSDSNAHVFKFRRIFHIIAIFVLVSFFVSRTFDYDDFINSTQSVYRKIAAGRCFANYQPYNPVIYYNLAFYHYQLGLYDKTVFFLDEALKIEPNFNLALLMYCDLMLRKGDKDLAKKYFSRIRPYELKDDLYSYRISHFDKNIYLSLKNNLK
jgi:hypothetical protein